MKLYILLLALAVSSDAFFKPGSGPRQNEKEDEQPIFEDDEDVEFTPSPEPPAVAPTRIGVQKCGVRLSTMMFRSGLLLDQQKARYGEFNWVVPIFEVKWDGFENYTNVGSLIHPQVVLTVAHYFTEKKNWKIRAGDHNIASMKERYRHQSIYVNTVEIHPQFKPSQLKFDVALLFLSSPVTPAPHIGFACLPPAQFVTPSGTSCIVTGWGEHTFISGQTSDVLKMTEVPVVSKDDCQEALRNRNSQAFKLHKSWMCAGGVEGKDSCVQDGGGPLVCPIANTKDQFYQAGLVSWGHSCGLAGVPGVYTDVSVVRDWIDERMAANGYTTDTYTS